MDLKKIKSIIKLVEESSVQEVSVEEGDFAITVSKQSSLPPVAQPSAQVLAPAATPSQAAPPPSQSEPTRRRELCSGSLCRRG